VAPLAQEPGVKLLDWYIGRTILNHSLLVLAVLLALFTFVTFVDELQDLGIGNYDLLAVAQYIVLTIPQRIYELFPMAALLGTMLGMSSLAVDSELIVMRASGVSLVRIVGAVLKIGGVFVIVAVLVGEVVTPYTETLAQRGRAEALEKSIKQRSDFGLWMRDHTTYVSVREVLPDLSILGIKVYEFDGKRHLRSAVHASEGRFDEGKWLLTNVNQTLFEENKAKVVDVEAAYWSSALAPEILSVFLVKPEQMSAWHLNSYINHLQENSQDTSQYELAFWQKVIMPFATAAMVVLAIPFVFRQLRSGGFGHSLFIGIMLGLGFYVTNRGFGFFVLVYDIHPIIGAITPTLVFFLAALFMLRKVA
jgi:lipopolysaccharide export system permease protein